MPVEVRDPQTGRSCALTVIGVLTDTVPLEMAGISTSQRTLAAAFPGRAPADDPLPRAAPGVDPDAAAAALESAFLANGMEAESFAETSTTPSPPR